MKINTNKINRDFLKLLSELEDKNWNIKVNNNWTVKEVVAHLIGWEKESAKLLPKVWKTHKKPWFLETSDYSNFNKKSVTKYKNFSPKQLIEEWKFWQNKLEEEIKKIGTVKLKSESKLFSWVFDESENNHYLRHLNQIKKALDKNR